MWGGGGGGGLGFGGVEGGREELQMSISRRHKRASGREPRTYEKFLLMATDGDVTYVKRV